MSARFGQPAQEYWLALNYAILLYLQRGPERLSLPW